jgi:predicted short-subunit dehydrogenase-like oxidoreductase (DUF2520 family)
MKIVLLGAGNLATHLGPALQKAGHPIIQVFSRTNQSAQVLATMLNCSFTTDISAITPGADAYIFALTDNVLPAMLKRFPLRKALVIHTSGNLPLDIINQANLEGGVLYPLQTFTRNITPDWLNTPICTEASGEHQLELINRLASSISNNVREISSQQRSAIHLAAVFACNFTNHMLHIAHDILNQNDISPDILQPIIDETMRKAKQQAPALNQTGPAVRGDSVVMQRHKNQLASLPLYSKLYTFISESIIASKKNQ